MTETLKPNTKWLLMFTCGTLIEESSSDEPPLFVKFCTGFKKLDAEYSKPVFEDVYEIFVKSNGNSNLGVAFYR